MKPLPLLIFPSSPRVKKTDWKGSRKARAEQEKQPKQGKKEEDAEEWVSDEEGRKSEICWLEGTDNTCATIIQRPPEDIVEMDQEKKWKRVSSLKRSIIQ